MRIRRDAVTVYGSLGSQITGKPGRDEIGGNELLTVSFGTSFNDSRAEDIKGIEDAGHRTFVLEAYFRILFYEHSAEPRDRLRQ